MGDAGVEGLEPLPCRGDSQHGVEEDSIGEQDEEDVRAYGQHDDAQAIESVEMCVRAGQADRVLVKAVSMEQGPRATVVKFQQMQ